MLQSSPMKPSAAAAHPTGSVVTDPTLRLMAAAAAAAGGRPGRLAGGPPSELTPPRPSVAAAAAANELYASLLYSHHHQLDRAAMLMHQHAHHHGPFSPVPTALPSQRASHQHQQQQQQQSQPATAQPPHAHTGAGFGLPQYQPSHHHPHHLQAAGPAAAAAAFESYSQSLATLSQLSHRLQLQAAAGTPGRLPGPPPTALGVDPYLAAAAAAAQGGRAGSPVCKRPSNSPPRTPINDKATTPIIKSQATPHHESTGHGNPYDFCEPDLSPDDKFHHIRYKDDDIKEPHRRHHHHHHNSHHLQQQQRKPDVGVVSDICRDENHNAFNDALQLHRRDKRQEVGITHEQTVLPVTSAHARQHDQRRQPVSVDPASKGVAAVACTGNGNDAINEFSSRPEASGSQSAEVGYRRHKRARRHRADFTHGSMIQLSDGRVKRIEDMRTEDFAINSSSSSVKLSDGRGMTSSQLVLVSSRVVHIRLNHDTSTAVLGFVVDNNIHSPVFTYLLVFIDPITLSFRSTYSKQENIELSNLQVQIPVVGKAYTSLV